MIIMIIFVKYVTLGEEEDVVIKGWITLWKMKNVGRGEA